MCDQTHPVRLSQVSKALNISSTVLVELLRSEGYTQNIRPTTKLTEQQYDLIRRHFSQTKTIDNEKIKKPQSRKLKIGQGFGHVKLEGRRFSDHDCPWHIGQIARFNDERGFGLVQCWSDKQDYFIHISNVHVFPSLSDDYVIFKLGPSRKKAGTTEAFQLSSISKFRGHSAILIGKYLEYKDTAFRKAVIEALDDDSLIDLLQEEIEAFSIDNSEDFENFKQVVSFFTTAVNKPSLIHRIEEILTSWAGSTRSVDYQIQLWVNGLIKAKPDEGTLRRYFVNAYKEERIKILLLLDYPEQQNMLRELSLTINPKQLLDLLLEYQQGQTRFIDLKDIKAKVGGQGVQSDNHDNQLLDYFTEQFKETLDDQQKFLLFLDGYTSFLPKNYFLENIESYSRKEVEIVLDSGELSTSEAISSVKKLLEESLASLYSQKEPNIDAGQRGSLGELSKIESHVQWIVEVVNKFLSVDDQLEIEEKLLSDAPHSLLYELWDKGFLQAVPTRCISELLLQSHSFREKVEYWIRAEKLSKDEIANILFSNLRTIEDIKSREQFYTLYHHLCALVTIGYDVVAIKEAVRSGIQSCSELAIWMEGLSKDFQFDEFKRLLVFLSPEHQVKFLKKLFWLADTNQMVLTVEHLNELTRIDFDVFQLSKEYFPDVLLDISVDVIIRIITSVQATGRFHLASNEMKEVLRRNLVDRSAKFQLRGFFEKCEGRNEGVFDWNGSKGEIRKIPYGNGQFYFAIEFKYDERLVEEVRQIPGRRWNPEQGHWGVPSQYEDQVKKFAQENSFFIDFEGSNYANNTHLAAFKRTTVPGGINFCEGRLSMKRDRLFNRQFWWCHNKPCFQHCETLHDADKWEEYTLMDFLRILNLNIDDANSVGGIVERGKYYQFISMINRYNRLLEKMHCNECQELLFPLEDTHYAFYRVTRFRCENPNCVMAEPAKGNEIYLHHCLNGKCADTSSGIIDSRESHKCPNGLYICANTHCGCCCSHKMFEHRLENLRLTDKADTYVKQQILANLTDKVKRKEGHLERAKHFCFKCGSEEPMSETSREMFFCGNCGMEYDVEDNNFDRPNRHLTD